ncbi:MAG: 4Fe-4S dicluster domain-containing protein, partial [Spirochaetales bacterium]|nr:4Fe-4S dicluster domain-containing protein [Spirochaetales bacterium]
MGFAFDFENCTECRRCMIACSIEKTGTVSMEASRIQVVRSWPNLPALEVCRFEDCPGKPCIPVCPVDAIMENGNMVLIDADVCTSCGLC